MKKILTIIVVLFSISAHPQQPDSGKLTAKQIYNDVKDGFDRLVKNLEGPAKYTYQSYVNQYKIEGISELVSHIIPFVILLVLVVISFKKGMWKEQEPKNKWALSQIFSTIIFTIVSLSMFLSMNSILTKIINPQYHAIQEIIKTIK